MNKAIISLFLSVFVLSGCQVAVEADLSQNQENSQENYDLEVLDEGTEKQPKKEEPVSLGPISTKEVQRELEKPVVKPDPEPIIVKPDPVVIPIATSAENKATSTPVVTGSTSLIYNVAFAAQAPFANWNHPFDEACEEASMIMVNKYYKDQSLNNSVMSSEIVALVDWQTKRGYKVDLTANETKEVLLDYFGLTSRLITNPTVADIKKELDQGSLIIVPAAGRELFNPYFTPPGPIYHMLVIIGYDDKTGEFITNDPGTRRGEKFRYSYQTLLNANHNWNHSLAEGGMTNSEMAQGSQIIVVVDK